MTSKLHSQLPVIIIYIHVKRQNKPPVCASTVVNVTCIIGEEYIGQQISGPPAQKVELLRLTKILGLHVLLIETMCPSSHPETYMGPKRPQRGYWKHI